MVMCLETDGNDFSYNPADATATRSSVLLHQNQKCFISGPNFSGFSSKIGCKIHVYFQHDIQSCLCYEHDIHLSVCYGGLQSLNATKNGNRQMTGQVSVLGTGQPSLQYSVILHSAEWSMENVEFCTLVAYFSCCLFSPLGKLAVRAVYFACVNLFLFLNADKLSQDPLDRFLQSLCQMIGISTNMTDLNLFL